MNDFPQKELLEVIKGQARLEQKIDSFISNTQKLESTLSNKLSVIESNVKTIDHDVNELKTKRREDRAYIAALSAFFSFGFAILFPIIRKYFGF